MNAVLKAVQSAGEDYEWYPTTQRMIDIVHKDMLTRYDPYDRNKKVTVPTLDIGAGDGRVVSQLTQGDRYAIEKSQTLVQNMPADVFVIGTDFHQQTLIDKEVQVIFCNPPYSEYAQWMERIIKEAHAQVLYFIVPERWRNSEEIKQVIKLRHATEVSLGFDDFYDAERKARAKVEIVAIVTGGGRMHHRGPDIDPFNLWFNENFGDMEAPKSKVSDYQQAEAQRDKIRNALVDGRGDLINALVDLYDLDMDKLIGNYRKLCELDPELMQELEANLDGVKANLRMKIGMTKKNYWQELFDNMGRLTQRLTHKSREKILGKLTENTSVDFTAPNAHGILLWAIKNANHYFDAQLIDTVERMTEEANVKLYKSNAKVYTKGDWMYSRRPESLDRYQLEPRVVLHRCGGINTSEWGYEREKHGGLRSTAYYLIGDLLTVANNLGFDTTGTRRVDSEQWESNQAQVFTYFDHATGKELELIRVKAFKNGNLHINFNSRFMLRLNVEFGRLKGWVQSAPEAADELNIPAEEALNAFGSNELLPLDGSVLQLTCDHAA